MDPTQVAPGTQPATPAVSPQVAPQQVAQPNYQYSPEQVTPGTQPQQTQPQAPAELQEWIEIPNADGTQYTKVEKSKLPEVWLSKEAEIRRLRTELESRTRPEAPQAPVSDPVMELARGIYRDLRMEMGADVNQEDLKKMALVQARHIHKERVATEQRIERQFQLQSAKAQFESIQTEAAHKFGVELRTDPAYVRIFNEYPGLDPKAHYAIWLGERVASGQVTPFHTPQTTTGLNGAVTQRTNGNSVYSVPPPGGPQTPQQDSEFVQHVMSRYPTVQRGTQEYERIRQLAISEEQKLRPMGVR